MGPANGGPINLKSARLQDVVWQFATLSAADLEAADMSGADLVHARFDQANLSAANLSHALLDYADFAGANLAKGNLRGASLRFATLSAADLEAADMSSADLVHARFDQANLSTANLSNALLDHADFAGANLTKVNLCGASLHHAKNLTQSQLEESIGSDSTILPPHLRESVSWSVGMRRTETTALKRRDLRPRALHTVDIDAPLISCSSRPVWVGALLIGGALVTTGLGWQHTIKVVPLDMSGAQRGSARPFTEPKASPNAEMPLMPSAANTADRTESAPGQRPALEKGGETVPQETNALPELQASDDAKRSIEPFEPNEQAPGGPGDIHEPKSNEASEASRLVSTTSPVGAASRHGLPAEASDTSAFVSANPPVRTSRHGTVPSLSEPLPPPVVTSPLSSFVIKKDVQTVSPFGAETAPTPVRNPARPHGAKGQNSVDKKIEGSAVIHKDLQTVSPPSAETPPTPVRNPARAHRASQRSRASQALGD